MIKAVIFDMDGLLIDSEQFWQQAEVELMRPLGVPIQKSDCTKTMGQRIDMAVQYWFDRYPWDNPTVQVVADNITKRVTELIIQNGKPLPGVIDTLNLLKQENIPMAIASSSPSALISSVVDTFEIRDYFTILCSAELEKYGKPHPGVYLSAAEQLGILPKYCLVFEDSISGLIAAKAAGMAAIGIPENINKSDPRFAIADMTLSSMTEFNLNMLKLN